MWMRCLRAAAVAIVVALAQVQSVAAAAPERTATVEDALAIRNIRQVSLHPSGRWVAVDLAGTIQILSTTRARTVERVLAGSHPQWSPDGSKLAYYADVAGRRQLHVYDRSSGAVAQLTSLEEGISSNPFIWVIDEAGRFAWSPDSTQIAFETRFTDHTRRPAPAPSNIRVLDRNTAYSAVQDGVFRTDLWEVYAPQSQDWTAQRMRVIEAEPARGLNKLVLVDVASKSLRTLTTRDQHFAPSWSPDGKSIAAIADSTMGVLFPGPARTELTIFDVRTGAERRIDTPARYVGSPRWSADGSRIALIVQRRKIGFRAVNLFFPSEGRWQAVVSPKGLSVGAARWVGAGNVLAMKLADRFGDTIWRVGTADATVEKIRTHRLDVAAFDVSADGSMVFTAQAADFPGRLFMLAARDRKPVELFDPNPQLASVRLGEQRRVTWRNKAGEEIDGVIVLPPEYKPGTRYPLIVDVYPRPPRDRFSLTAGPRLMGQMEAARGYVVFQPGLRAPHAPGSFSRDESFTEKARGARGIPVMVDDFTSGLAFLSEAGLIDPNRVCVYGHSMGGYVANFLMTETNIQCAVISSASSNLIWQYFTLPPDSFPQEVTSAGEDLYSGLDEYVAMSPLLRMNKANASVLMITGDRDWWTWLPEMLLQFNALRRLGRDVTWVRYADEGHVFAKPANINDSLTRIHRFFDERLAGSAAASGPASMVQ